MPYARRSALLAFCRSLPLVTEDVKWGNDLVFSIGGKMFAGFANDGKDATFGCKVPQEDFSAITAIEGIEPSKYAARFFWISVQDPKVLPEPEAIALLRGSYDLVKANLPAKLQKKIAEAEASPKPKAKAKQERARTGPSTRGRKALPKQERARTGRPSTRGRKALSKQERARTGPSTRGRKALSKQERARTGPLPRRGRGSG